MIRACPLFIEALVVEVARLLAPIVKVPDVGTLSTGYVPNRVTPPTVVEIGRLNRDPTLMPWSAKVTVTIWLPEVVANAGTAPPAATVAVALLPATTR